MSLQSYDKEIFDLVNLELKRQCDHLEMIASENFTYPEVMEVMGSVLTNKYAEGYPGQTLLRRLRIRRSDRAASDRSLQRAFWLRICKRTAKLRLAGKPGRLRRAFKSRR